jgi:uncharacterized delta-60 repeat protein
MRAFARPRRLSAAILGFVVAGAIVTSAWAAAGNLDTSFNGTGFTTTSFGAPSFADGVAVSGDKSVVVGGVESADGGDFAIARYNKNGTLDQTFGSGGRVTVDFVGGIDLATCVTFQGDKILVGGYTSPDGGLNFEVANVRLNKNGTPDTTFGVQGQVVDGYGDGYDFVNGIAVDGDKIAVAGATRLNGGPGNNNFFVARYKNNGLKDFTFDGDGVAVTDFNGGDDSAGGVKFQGDKLVAGGYVRGADFDFGLVRYLKTGVLDTTFDTDGKAETDFGSGDDFGHAVDVSKDRIVLVGQAADGGDQDFAAAVYGKTGQLDPTFGGDGKATLDVAPGDEDVAFGGAWGPGDTVVAGGAVGVDWDQGFAVARWTKTGVPDAAFGTGGSTVTPIGVTSGGFALDDRSADAKLVVAGYSDDDFAVARYLNK